MKKLLLLILLFFCVSQVKSQVNVGGAYAGCEETVPNYWSAYYSWTQSHYLQSEINYSGEIYGLTYFLCEANRRQYTAHQDNWRVWLVHYSGAYPTNFIDESTATLVYDGVFSGSGDEIWIPFSTPFTYNGTDNLAIIVANNNGGEANYPNIPGVKTDGIIAGSSIQANHSSTTAGPFQSIPSGGTITNQRPIIRLETCGKIDIPDAEFKATLLGLTPKIDLNNDGNIQCNEAASYKGTLTIFNGNITDLTGLEAFSSVPTINISIPGIGGAIDFLSNTAVQTLYLPNNGFTNINVSQNTILKNLYCQNNNLSSLDLSNNTQLKGLGVSNNQLTSLAFSSTVNRLDCKDNQISVLDVSNNNLKDLNCNNNPISTLDLSNSEELYEVKAQNCNLTTIDLSGSKPVLEYIYLDNNSLTIVDVSNAIKLSELLVNNNQLTTLNVKNGNNTNSLAFNAINNPNLTCIQVDDVAYSTTNWTSVDAAASFSTNCNSCTVNIPDTIFKNYLVGNTQINTNGDAEIQCTEAIAFSGNITVPNLGITDLTGIAAFTNITQLDCSINSLSSLDVSSNTALTILTCAYNSLTNLDLSANTALTELYCKANSFASLDVSSNTALKTLNCNENYLTNIDVSFNTALTSLSCSINSLTSLDVSSNTALRGLYCDNNSLTSLNVANGNNTSFPTHFASFLATNNPNLTCIQVDDVAYSTINWTNIDAVASFSTNCGNLSAANFALNNFSVYPNPVENKLNISLATEQGFKKAEIFTLLGKKILEANTNSIDMSSFPSGIYLLKIKNVNGEIAVRKIMKK